jgi:hypothetical protein
MIGMLSAMPLNAGKLYDPVDDLPTANRTGAALFDFNHTASQTITDGKVESISDRFGNGFSAVQSSADSRPTSSANGIGSLTTAHFPLAEDILSGTTSMASLTKNIGQVSAFVTHQGTNSSGGIFVASVGGGGSFRFCIAANETTTYIFGRRLDTDSGQNVNLPHNTAIPGISSVTANYASALATIRANGLSNSGSFHAAGNTSNTDSQSVSIGITYTGHIADILITPSILAGTDRIDYEGWQAQRGSGLASNLPATHRYRYHRPRTRTPK